MVKTRNCDHEGVALEIIDTLSCCPRSVFPPRESSTCRNEPSTSTFVMTISVGHNFRCDGKVHIRIISLSLVKREKIANPLERFTSGFVYSPFMPRKTEAHHQGKNWKKKTSGPRWESHNGALHPSCDLLDFLESNTSATRKLGQLDNILCKFLFR